MGSNKTPVNPRGFLIPDLAVNNESIWENESSYTEMNPRAGIPENLQLGTGLIIQASGEQIQDVKIITQNGGTAGNNADYFWEDENGVQYGRDWKNGLTGWQYWIESAGGFIYDHSDSVELFNGSLLVVTEGNVPATNLQNISLRKKKRDGTIDLLHTFYSKVIISNVAGHPVIAELSDGSLYVAHFNFTTTLATNITAHRSLDGGDNWQKITTRALSDDLSLGGSGYTVKDMRLCVCEDIILLYVELVANFGTDKNCLAQYRSIDGGLSYSLVGDISQPADGLFHGARAVSLGGSECGVAYISATNDLHFRKIPNSSIQLSSNDWSSQEVEISAGAIQWADNSGSELIEGDLAIWKQDNRLFVFARVWNNGKYYGFYSTDEGESWVPVASVVTALDDGVVFDFGSWAELVDHIHISPFEGRSSMICHHSGDVHILYFGGYSSQCYPSSSEVFYERNQSQWNHTYIPLATPDISSFWNTNGVGSHSVGLQGLNIQTSTNLRNYDYTGTVDQVKGFHKFKLEIAQGSDRLTDKIAIILTQDTGANSRMINLRFDGTGFDIRHNSGLVQSVAIAMTQPVEILIGWNNGEAVLYYRHDDGKHNKDWAEVSWTVPNYASGAGNTISFGHIALFAGSLESNWSEVHISQGNHCGEPETLNPAPAPYPRAGDYVYIDGGMRITTQSAPARGEDEYQIKARYDFPVENLWPDVALSPRIMWRSSDDTVAQEIAFYTDQVVQNTALSTHLSGVYGLSLQNINFQTANLYRRNGAVWDLVMAINLSEGLSGTFDRKGNKLQPDVVGAGFYLHFNEAKGWRAILIEGESQHIVKIKQNSEGVWGKNSDRKRAILLIDTDLSDPALLPTSGQIQLVPDSCVVVIDGLDDVSGGDSALKLEIPIQPSLEDYFQIGSMLYGSVVFPAPQYERGRNISWEANTETTETLDQMFFGRALSSGRRVAQIAWTEPVESSLMYLKDPNYWELSGGAGSHPVASDGDSPLVMMGIWEQLQNRDPLVYLPALKTGVATQILNRDMDHLLCRSQGDISIESVIGDELLNENFRIATITLVEVT